MLEKYAQKSNIRFNCLYCDYFTCKKSSWIQHLNTRKHMNAKNANYDAKNANEKYALENSTNTCSGCGKMYKHFSSLSRHKKICSKYAQLNSEEIITMTKKEYNLVLENQELKGKLNAYEKHTISAINSCINSNNTQNINIQLHLQEKFSSAINFSQLIEDINVSLKELQYTSEHGYIQGVSNIMIQAVKDCSENNRPIHHIPNHPDKTQEGLYIKDCDEWSKDIDGKFEKGIDSITQKHIDALKQWEDNNPNWYNTETGKEKYNEMVSQITSGVSNTREKIKKLISKQVNLPIKEDNIKI